MRERLRSFPLLEPVGEPALHRLLSEANWFGLPGGMLLPRDGENDRALFLVVTGSLGVFVEDDNGARRLVAHIPAGETVGEMSADLGRAPFGAARGAARHRIVARQRRMPSMP